MLKGVSVICTYLFLSTIISCIVSRISISGFQPISASILYAEPTISLLSSGLTYYGLILVDIFIPTSAAIHSIMSDSLYAFPEQMLYISPGVPFSKSI